MCDASDYAARAVLG
jgi:hypothetical protein